MEIRESISSERSQIEKIHIKAFGKDKGPEIGTLVMDLFEDDTAEPTLSLVAVSDGNIVGHILFTKVSIICPTNPVSAAILAPLAILPEFQNRGVGRLLIRQGLVRLQAVGVALVFVLGHPDYYPRYGFSPAGQQGFQAPYPIPAEHSGAWMVQALAPGVLGRVKGTVKCSEVLDQPQHWRE